MTGPDPVLQDEIGSTRETATVGQNFAGVSNLNGVAPPDTDGDVGPNHYFQMINLSYAVWDKNGNQLLAPADNQTIWEGFDNGQPYDNANDGDPIVLYDEYADRWLVSQFAPQRPIRQVHGTGMHSNSIICPTIRNLAFGRMVIIYPLTSSPMVLRGQVAELLFSIVTL